MVGAALVVLAGRLLLAVQLVLAAPGDLEPVFGVGGVAITPIGGVPGELSGLVLQPDGAVVVAGSTGAGIDPNDLDVALVRYTAAGDLDPSFGAGGIVRTFGPFEDAAHAIALAADGGLIVAGTVSQSATGDRELALFRYLAERHARPELRRRRTRRHHHRSR